MPRSSTKPAPEFVPVDDPEQAKTDPMISRAFCLFDGLRKRQVGPDKAAYVVAQFFAANAGSASHPIPVVHVPVPTQK